MELRVLRNFITVVEEEGVSAAADVLRISQPALSRQIKELEEELSVTLFERGNRGRALELTEEGRLLYRRAREITELAERAKTEVMTGEEVTGDVHIAAAQTAVMRVLARAAVILRERHPQVRVRLHDDYGTNIVERLDNGLADFGVLVQPTDMSRYDYMPLPGGDPMGVLMRHDHPLASHEAITAADLKDTPIIVPQGVIIRGNLSGWFGHSMKSLNIVGTMNLMYNASCFAQEGFACVIGPQRLVDTTWESGLVFRPLDPPANTQLAIAGNATSRSPRPLPHSLKSCARWSKRRRERSRIMDINAK